MEYFDLKKGLEDLSVLDKQRNDLKQKIGEEETRLYSAIKKSYDNLFVSRFENNIKKYNLSYFKENETLSEEDLINELKTLHSKNIELNYKYDLQKQNCISYFNALKKEMVKDFDENSEPALTSEIPDKVAIGNYTEKCDGLYEIINETNIKLPYTLSTVKNGNVIINAKRNEMNKRLETIVSGIVMKYMESFPSGKIRSVLHSSQYDSLNALSALFLSIQNGKIALNTQLKKLSFREIFDLVNNNCEIVKSKMFEFGCKDINELYKKDIQTECFQLIVLYDSLQALNTEDVKYLSSLMSEAKFKQGVRIIMVDDFSEEEYRDKPRGFTEEIKKIVESNETFALHKDYLIDVADKEIIPVKFSDKVSEQGIYDYCSAYCKLQDQLRAKYLSYEEIGFGKYNTDKANYDSILIPVGLCDNKIVEMGFSCKSDYPIANLIMGVPGTGKSKLIDALILNGSIKYSPKELQFQLLDFKDGVSSSLYVDQAKLPHIQIISSNNDPDDANIILNKIRRERESRNELFKEYSVNDISDFNKLMDKRGLEDSKLPRIIIIIDECQVLFADSELASQMEDISRRCRSTGIHLVLSTQALQGSMNKTKEFIDGRYCFEISDSDAHELLNRDYVSRMKQDVPKGSFKAYASTDSGNTCKIMTVAYDGGKTAYYAEQIRNKWNHYKINTLIAGEQSPLYLDNYDEETLFYHNNLRIPIGQDYVALEKLYVDGENSEPILMVGTNQDIADSIHQSVLLSAVARNAKTFYIDATRSKTVLSKIQSIDATRNIQTGGKQNYLEKLKEIYSVFISRKNTDDTNFEPVVFAINGIDLIEDFKNNKKYVASMDISNNKQSQSFKMREEDFSDNEKENLLDYLLKNREESFSEEKIDNSVADEIDVDIKGKDSLLQIMEEGFTVNILVCVSMNNVSFKDNTREPVFTSSDKKLLTDIDHKIVFNETDSGLTSIMETKFKEKIMESINDNMAILSEKQKFIYRFRYYQYDNDVFEKLLGKFIKGKD